MFVHKLEEEIAVNVLKHETEAEKFGSSSYINAFLEHREMFFNLTESLESNST